ncbi:phosphoribosylaminoimidazolesuccinocarboxamide synthase [Blastococcus sp. Marseille-P5729]|uniref:phosphoribosylaminoimidazolesuccinocarboxamide synthase n=1 Tax=Blastococcus sp. Marseille-P5729 TaxID=2086582 RepID=UPI000D0ED575|nr:phosphoribosylaminoimidazolesuccinocarboxamide synthase [Blastococcus sp. Marseille-P5729]
MSEIDLKHVASGKVRDIYEVDDEHLLFVTSDRISAYDYVLSTPIPDKGAILTALSTWWFEQLADVVPNHLVSVDDDRIPTSARGRSMLVRRLSMVPVECVARGYLTGSGLKEYAQGRAVCGVPLPDGLVDGSELPHPIFTPATKAELGDHDENVSYEQVAASHGEQLASRLRELTLAVYSRGRDIARRNGIIVADTKFEFGRTPDGALVLADEVLTPDSSRFWPADQWQPGRAQASYDKQFVRDWLTGPSGWDQESEPPALPDDVVAATRAKYVEAYERITGLRFDDWLARFR